MQRRSIAYNSKNGHQHSFDKYYKGNKNIRETLVVPTTLDLVVDWYANLIVAVIEVFSL